MKTLYKSKGFRAFLKCEFHHKTATMYAWLITDIFVPAKYRGRGHGHDLLERVTADADLEGVSLLLEIRPTGSEMDYDRLERWYRRNGFRPAKRIDGFFIRKPQ